MHTKFQMCCLRVVEEKFAQNAEQNKKTRKTYMKMQLRAKARPGILYIYNNRSIQRSRTKVSGEIAVENFLESRTWISQITNTPQILSRTNTRDLCFSFAVFYFVECSFMGPSVVWIKNCSLHR